MSRDGYHLQEEEERYLHTQICIKYFFSMTIMIKLKLPLTAIIENVYVPNILDKSVMSRSPPVLDNLTQPLHILRIFSSQEGRTSTSCLCLQTLASDGLDSPSGQTFRTSNLL